MQKFVIIVAAGSGVRMGSATPKQFMMLGGRAVLMHAIDAFRRSFSGIPVILALNGKYRKRWEALCAKVGFRKNVQVVSGGRERFQSVRNCLARVGAKEALVAVHDGVRPLVSEGLIRRVFQAAERHGAAVPVLPLEESLRQTKGKRNRAADRREFRLVQTPQCFRVSWLRHAYSLAGASSRYSDDAAVVEAAGYAIHLVKGERRNIKITFPEDLQRARALLPASSLP